MTGRDCQWPAARPGLRGARVTRKVNSGDSDGPGLGMPRAAASRRLPSGESESAGIRVGERAATHLGLISLIMP